MKQTAIQLTPSQQEPGVIQASTARTDDEPRAHDKQREEQASSHARVPPCHHAVPFSHVACRHTLTPSNSPTAIQGVLPMCTVGTVGSLLYSVRVVCFTGKVFISTPFTAAATAQYGTVL